MIDWYSFDISYLSSFFFYLITIHNSILTHNYINYIYKYINKYRIIDFIFTLFFYPTRVQLGTGMALFSHESRITMIYFTVIRFERNLKFVIKLNMIKQKVIFIWSYIIGIAQVTYLKKEWNYGFLHTAFLCYEFSNFVEIYLSKYLQQKQNPKIRFAPFSKFH